MLLFPEIYYEGLFVLLYVMALTFLIIVGIVNHTERWPKPTEFVWAVSISFIIMSFVMGLKVFHII